ncbi:MAG: hypothetical protein M0Z88_02420 [Actinomycetota bacterium]|nr:hypothetical protein [Actinomycetota bacterium]
MPQLALPASKRTRLAITRGQSCPSRAPPRGQRRPSERGPISSSLVLGLGQRVPVGATVDRTQRRITFHGSTVVLAAVASGPGTPMYSFEIAGMVNPTIGVPTGAHISIEVVNRDSDMAHGLVVTADGAASSSRRHLHGKLRR